MNYQEIRAILAEESSLLDYRCQKISRDLLATPSSNTMLDVFRDSDRSSMVIANLNKLYRHGRLSNTGYLSIFPVDQGLEHTAAFSFYHNPFYFDPVNIVKLAIEAGCNGVTSSLGVLGLVSQKYADQIPMVAKINHSEHLTYPAKIDQILFGSVEKAYNMGAVGVGMTVYFGSNGSHRQITTLSEAIERAHRLGLFVIIWCYPRNPAYIKDGVDYSVAVDITAQAIHLAVSMGADIVKQKMPIPNHGFAQLDFSYYKSEMYEKLLTDNPIDLVRYQVLHAYSGKIGLINSGGDSNGQSDLKEAVRAAVINKRAGGQGLIMGRKVFNKPFAEGVALIQAVQDVYLSSEITLA